MLVWYDVFFLKIIWSIFENNENSLLTFLLFPKNVSFQDSSVLLLTNKINTTF